MLMIRLRRMGRRHSPFYRVVVSESRKTPRGPFNEILGTYDPRLEPAAVIGFASAGSGPKSGTAY